MDCIREAACHVGGLDNWTFRFWKLLNFTTVDWLRRLLVLIEDQEAPWPKDTTTARAAFIRKPGTDEHDPLSFRILSILAVLYRTWAKARLADLRPWIRSWATDDLFSDIEGYGAADASYLSAWEVEECHLLQEHFSGAKVDIWKACDRLDREVVVAVALRAGLPAKIGVAYLSFMQKLRYSNTLAVGLGADHVRDLSIPQGCPFSMAFLACVLLPWCRAMRACSVVPRVLADDLRIFAAGPDHTTLVTCALRRTFVFIEGIGGSVAVGPGKSSFFSSDPEARTAFENTQWGSAGASRRISVVLDERDLGSHADYT